MEKTLKALLGIVGVVGLLVCLLVFAIEGFEEEFIKAFVGSVLLIVMGFGNLWVDLRREKNKEDKVFQDGMHIDEVSKILGSDFVLENVQMIRGSEGIKEYVFTSQKNSSSLRRFETQNDRITKVY